ncbi:hypothetical protein KM043_001550 [Ampulex compressa]|nr:hypothetical protein KM043_001550 [Ampulex compressa]
MALRAPPRHVHRPRRAERPASAERLALGGRRTAARLEAFEIPGTASEHGGGRGSARGPVRCDGFLGGDASRRFEPCSRKRRANEVWGGQALTWPRTERVRARAARWQHRPPTPLRPRSERRPIRRWPPSAGREPRELSNLGPCLPRRGAEGRGGARGGRLGFASLGPSCVLGRVGESVVPPGRRWAIGNFPLEAKRGRIAPTRPRSGSQRTKGRARLRKAARRIRAARRRAAEDLARDHGERPSRPRGVGWRMGAGRLGAAAAVAAAAAGESRERGRVKRASASHNTV